MSATFDAMDAAVLRAVEETGGYYGSVCAWLMDNVDDYWEWPQNPSQILRRLAAEGRVLKNPQAKWGLPA